MPSANERIPIPWPQRWELLREKLLPVLCYIATLSICAVLWRYYSRVAPNAVGEVYSESATINSPCNGDLLPLANSGDEQWPLFAKVEKGKVLARVADRSHDDQVIEIVAPFTGMIAKTSAVPGQPLRRGDPILKLVSPTPDFIVCHLAAQWETPPTVGTEVAVRLRGHAMLWYTTTVEAIGPTVEPGPTYKGADALAPIRGLPIRLALPAGLDLTPGSLLEVRFPLGSQPR